jgi:hypothetical protein
MADIGCCGSAIVLALLAVVGFSLLAGIAGLALYLTGGLFGFAYYAWSVFEEKILGKKHGAEAGPEAGYSIDDLKPA